MHDPVVRAPYRTLWISLPLNPGDDRYNMVGSVRHSLLFISGMISDNIHSKSVQFQIWKEITPCGALIFSIFELKSCARQKYVVSGGNILVHIQSVYCFLIVFPALNILVHFCATFAFKSPIVTQMHQKSNHRGS